VYGGTWGDGSLTWDVTTFGGARQAERNDDDPFLTADRGLWFDGRYNYMSIEGLLLSHTWSIEAWTNPITSGTLFSTSRIHEHNSQIIAHIGFLGGKLEFEDKASN
jgi:hypothetical protein